MWCTVQGTLCSNKDWATKESIFVHEENKPAEVALAFSEFDF